MDVERVTNLLAQTQVKQHNVVSFKGKSLKLNSADDATEIVKAIRESKDVQGLCLEGNTVGVDAAKVISEALAARPEFERALWSDMFTGRLRSEIPPAMESLGNAIISSKAHLVELDLSDNAFGPDGVKACAKLLSSSACYSLKILRFNNNGLGVGGGKILSQALLSCHKASGEAGQPFSLEVFISGRNRLENPGAKELANAFKTIGTLVEVQMPQNGIQHQGISALADSFKSNLNMKILNLNDNIFTEKGAEAMAEVLPGLKNLEVINFGDCLVKTAGAKALAQALQKGVPNLKELNLSFDEIDAEGALAISEASQNKDFLEKLDLNGNCIGEEGVTELRGQLEDSGKPDVLGSMSDDEGEPSDDEEDDELSGVGNGDEQDDDGNDESASPNVSLEVTGTSLKAESPLLGDDEEIQNELQKAEYTEAVRDFLQSPSAERLKSLPARSRAAIIQETLKDDIHDADKIAKCFTTVTAALKDNNEATFEISDAILEPVFRSSDCKEGSVANALLVHLGLLKSEEKVEPVKDLSGPLHALEHVVTQEYFPRTLKTYFKVFLYEQSKALDAYSSSRHRLLQKLFQM